MYGDAPGKGIFYGLIRPSIKGSTSAVINSYDLKLEFYPISFIGFVVGHQKIQSDFDGFPFFNCDEIRCKGELKRDYVQFRTALGFGPIVAMIMTEESRNIYDDPEDEALPVAEFRFAVRANPDYDEYGRYQYMFGFKDQDQMYALVTEYTYFNKSKQYNKMNLVAYQTKAENSNVIYGIGSFESTDQKKGTIAVVQYVYRFSPSFKLF